MLKSTYGLQKLLRTGAPVRFTHIATPEENSYIEAFHSIIQREVIDRFEFDSFYHAKHTIAAHRNWYDNRRLHRQIGMTPKEKWEQNIHLTIQERKSKTEPEKPSVNTGNYYKTSSTFLSN